MTRKIVFKGIIGAIAGLFLAVSTAAFAHNMGYMGNQRGPGMTGQPCQWNTTAQGAYGPMHNQAFHQNMHGMMHNQAVNQNMPGPMHGPATQQGAPCGLNPQCPAAQAATDNATP